MAIEPSVRDRALALVDQMGDDLARSLPEGFKADRFRSAFLNLAVHNPDIFKATPESLRSALLKCASDGLVPDSRHAVILPFYDKDAKTHIAQYIPMVQGIIARSRELGETLSITANVVYANDVFQFDESDPTDTVHKRQGMNTDRGDVVGAYAIYRDGQGRVMHREIMDLRELEKTHASSKAANSPAWRNWTSEMYRKTVIRRGSKYIAMSEALRRIVEREDEYVDFNDAQPTVALPANYNPLKDRRPAAIEHKPGDAAAMDTGASRASPQPATADRPAADSSPSASGAASSKEPPKKVVDKPEEAKKPATLTDAERARLRAYDSELFAITLATDLPAGSNGFWGADFPDEGTLLFTRTMMIYDAHKARAAGKGSTADTAAALAAALA